MLGADVGTIHLRAATLVVSNKGDQRLLQEAGIVTGICGIPHFQGRQAHIALPPTGVTGGCPHSLSFMWPQPAIWHFCPVGKELPGSGRQMG